MNAATIRRFAGRLAAITVPLVTAVTLAAAPAEARIPTPTATVPTAPTMTITIREMFLVGFDVCISGTTTTPGTWSANVEGARSDGSVIALSAPTLYGNVYSPGCFQVLENGAAAGEWTIRFTFVRGGVVYARVGGGSWDPFTHEHSWDTA